MSYILDALNRSEKERERKQTPSLKIKHDDIPKTRFQPRHFFYLLVLLVTVNSVGLLAYFWTDLTSDNNVSRAKLNSMEVPTEKSTNAETTTSAQQSFGLDTLSSGKAISVVESAKRYDGKTMAQNINAKLPKITITSHIYAADSDLRMVNINGDTRKEGDFISDSLVLTKITETGILLEFYGETFEINVVEDWLLDL